MRPMETPLPDLELARSTLAAEARAVAALADRIGEDFARAARTVFDCPGKVVLTGMGKAGIIAQKISGTLASTGTQSIFLHPVEAMHGDLGRVQRDDVVIALSDSGVTAELIRCLNHVKGRGAKLIAITGSADSPLGRFADVSVCYGPVEEACPLGLAPTVSTSCMLALGDALALTVMRMRKFTPEEFAAFHPAGGLAMKLMKVEDAMSFRTGERLAVVDERLTLAEALAQAEQSPRRAGAILIVDGQGKLTGIFTDADLRRLMVRSEGVAALTQGPISRLMKRDPKRVRVGALASEAMAVINRHRIDELPVVDDSDRPVGLIDVQDLIGIQTVTQKP